MPYDGILAPVGYVKDLENRAAKADLYKTELDKNKDCLPELSSFEPQTTSSVSFWVGTGIGFSLATILALMIYR